MLIEPRPQIAPSLLLCDFGNLEREVARLEAAKVKLLHLDVMDGNFVPNLTYGLPLVETFRRLTDCLLDAHLMIVKPERYVEQFVTAGADLVTIHREAVSDPRPVLKKIRDLGAAAGIALNPETPLADVENCLDLCDLVLVMSVAPGFGSQTFQPVALDKLRTLRKILPDDVLLEIDGGVNDQTIGDCVEAGADVLVAGSAIFKHPDYAERVTQLGRLAAAKGAATE
ncbi:MAG: ribulose-phosphate 3-epimerase [Planctomycetales bacterium]